jgi:hypothetical protein
MESHVVSSFHLQPEPALVPVEVGLSFRLRSGPPDRRRMSVNGGEALLGVYSGVAMAAENYQEPTPLFDSLPYYDNDLELHPILREKVQHELAVETQKIQQETLHPRIPPPIELFVVSPSLVQSQLPLVLSMFSSEKPPSRRGVGTCWSTPTAHCY